MKLLNESKYSMPLRSSVPLEMFWIHLGAVLSYFGFYHRDEADDEKCIYSSVQVFTDMWVVGV